jgi:hypothetical protein
LRVEPDATDDNNIIHRLRKGTIVNLICVGFSGPERPMIWWHVYLPDKNLTKPSHANKNLGWVSEGENLENGRTVYYLAARSIRA